MQSFESHEVERQPDAVRAQPSFDQSRTLGLVGPPKPVVALDQGKVVPRRITQVVAQRNDVVQDFTPDGDIPRTAVTFERADSTTFRQVGVRRSVRGCSPYRP